MAHTRWRSRARLLQMSHFWTPADRSSAGNDRSSPWSLLAVTVPLIASSVTSALYFAVHFCPLFSRVTWYVSLFPSIFPCSISTGSLSAHCVVPVILFPSCFSMHAATAGKAKPAC